jgi:ATP-binding protein involved in chromosome partitioning
MDMYARVMVAIEKIQDPALEQSLVNLGMIEAVNIDENQANIYFAPDTSACPLLDEIIHQIEQAVLQVDGIDHVYVQLVEPLEGKTLDRGDLSFGQVAHLNHAKRVIAVMSGKGGVGKSLVASLLAISLRRAGYKVGLLDADITGPSIPKMFFSHQPTIEYAPRAMLPLTSKTGVQVMSINFLLEKEDQAVIWRGPLVGRAIQQFWTDVLWGTLDYLIVDLPPGTSDAPLTVMQSLPVSGIVLVTSPQDLAGMVVRKAANMALQIAVPILGLVENMSFFIAPDTGNRYEVFGQSHAEAIAKAIDVPLLAKLPLDPLIALHCDQGEVEECQIEDFKAVVDWLQDTTPEALPPKMPLKTGPTATASAIK